MKDSIPQSPAFKEKLVISEFEKHPNFRPNIFEFDSNINDFVVRKTPIEYLFRKEDNDDEDKKPSLYSLTEKVTAVNEDEISDYRDQYYDGYAKIIASLCKYYSDKFRDDGRCMYDLPSREQFVFGFSKNDNSPQWYLTDTDPDFVQKSKTDELTIFFDCADSLQDELDWLEACSGRKFLPIRSQVKELFRLFTE